VEDRRRGQEAQLTRLEREVDALTAGLLGITEAETWLVDDLLRWRRPCADSKVPREAIGRPNSEELQAFAHALASGLDDFLGANATEAHEVTVLPGQTTGLVRVRPVSGAEASVRVIDPTGPEARALRSLQESIEKGAGQWLHFDRNLLVVTEDATFIAKPMERLYWLRSQALMDGDALVAAALSPGE
jgi:hypothetical protein